MAAHLRGTERLRLFFGGIFSFNHYHFLRAGLAKIPETSSANPGLGQLSQLSEGDWTGIADQLKDLDFAEKKELLARGRFYQSGFKNCYGFKDNGRVVYLQWIVSPSENEIISRKYTRRYALLSPRQVMLENAFTFPGWRERGLHLAGSAQLMRMAREQGCTNAICYVRKDNLAALNDFLELGFQMVKIMPEYKIFGWARRSLE